mgnify:CR=1 FL=1
MRFARYALAGLSFIALAATVAPAEAHHRGYDPYCRYPAPAYVVPPPRYYYPPPPVVYYPAPPPYYYAPVHPRPHRHPPATASFYFRF